MRVTNRNRRFGVWIYKDYLGDWIMVNEYAPEGHRGEWVFGSWEDALHQGNMEATFNAWLISRAAVKKEWI